MLQGRASGRIVETLDRLGAEDRAVVDQWIAARSPEQRLPPILWTEPPRVGPDRGLARPRAATGVLAVVAGILFYVLAVDRLGFHVTGLVLLAVWIRLLGASWRVTALVAPVATLAIHFAFYKALRVPLPWGMFERWAF